MGINLRILYYDLMDFGPELQSDRPLCECPLTYFSFYNGRPLTDPGCLYIVKPEQLAEVAENTPCSFLCLGEPQRHELGGSVSVLWFRDESRFLELLSKLSEIFHSYMDWLNALELAVCRKKPLDEFGRLSLPFFRRPISLFKYNFFILFSVYDETYGTLPADQYRYTTGTYLNDQIMEDIEVKGDLPQVIAERQPYLHTSASGISALCVNLWDKERFLGTLQVDEAGEPVSEREYSLIYLLKEKLIRSIVENSLINFSLNSDLQGAIYDILEHRPVDQIRLKNALNTVGWGSTDTYSCIVCRPDRENIPDNALFFRGETLSQMFPHSIYVIYREQILLFCNQRHLDKTTFRAALNKLRSVMAEMRLVAGVSNNYESFDKSGYFYEAALGAISKGAGRNPGQNLYYYEAYMMEIAHERLLNGTVKEAFIPNELLRLIQYDRETDGDYCKVLRALLRNNMSCTDAARELYTHRNTVLNRLNRMKEYFHMNLNSFDYRMRLMTAFQVIDE